MKTTIALLALILALPFSSHAAPKAAVICRGGNIPSYQVLMRRAVREKLDAEGLVYKRVATTVHNVRRPKGIISPDFLSGLTLSSGPTPIVTYTGSFPTPEACSMTAKLKILVVYENARTQTDNEVTIPGTMLWRNGGKSVEELD